MYNICTCVHCDIGDKCIMWCSGLEQVYLIPYCYTCFCMYLCLSVSVWFCAVVLSTFSSPVTHSKFTENLCYSPQERNRCRPTCLRWSLAQFVFPCGVKPLYCILSCSLSSPCKTLLVKTKGSSFVFWLLCRVWCEVDVCFGGVFNILLI